MYNASLCLAIHNNPKWAFEKFASVLHIMLHIFMNCDQLNTFSQRLLKAKISVDLQIHFAAGSNSFRLWLTLTMLNFATYAKSMQSKWFANLELFCAGFHQLFLNANLQGRPNVILSKEYTVLYVYESLSVQKYLCTKTTTLMITFRTQSKMIFFSWVEKRYTAHEVWPNGGLFLKFSRYIFRGQAAL